MKAFTTIIQKVFKSIWFGLLTIPTISCGVDLGEAVLPTSEQGFTGLVLQETGGFPVVVFIYSNSPAAMDGRLHKGDLILGLSLDGSEKSLIPTQDLPLSEVIRFLEGPPGSTVTMKIRLKRFSTGETEALIPLRRAPRWSFKDKNGAIAYTFMDGNWWPLTIDRKEIAGMRHVPFREWSKVKAGVTTNDVISLIGEPLSIKDTDNPGESSWRYGCLTHVGSQVLEPRIAEILIRLYA